MQIHGGLVWLGDLPLERWYGRDPHPAHLRGLSEVQKHVVARDILGAGLR